MITLSNETSDTIGQFGRDLFYKQGQNLQSFEEAAQLSAQSIYETFRETDGQSTFALVRFYRLCKADELSPELSATHNSNIDSTDNWLALMGTFGDEPEWRNHQLSQNHRIIPINDTMSPMFKAALDQLSLMPQQSGNVTPVSVGQSALSIVKSFYVSDALSSSAIPDKDNFVIPYHIQSVNGIGSPFLSKASYIGLFFSKVSLSREDVEKFVTLAPSVSTLLASYDSGHNLWNI